VQLLSTVVMFKIVRKKKKQKKKKSLVQDSLMCDRGFTGQHAADSAGNTASPAPRTTDGPSPQVQ